MPQRDGHATYGVQKCGSPVWTPWRPQNTCLRRKNYITFDEKNVPAPGLVGAWTEKSTCSVNTPHLARILLTPLRFMQLTLVFLRCLLGTAFARETRLIVEKNCPGDCKEMERKMDAWLLRARMDHFTAPRMHLSYDKAAKLALCQCFSSFRACRDGMHQPLLLFRQAT